MKGLQQQVQQAIDQMVESGLERGLQVAVYRHGELVVDAVAGVADPAAGHPVAADTLFYCYSVGLGVTATVIHLLAERGVFSYETPIVDLWPEFGAHGKERATVRHVLTHAVGVPGLPGYVTAEDLCDWQRMCALIADAQPLWEPGTKIGYHAYTSGYILGEIVRRATGKQISQVLREEVTGPLGVAGELYFGVPESELDRLARQEDQAAGLAEALAMMPDDSVMFRMAPRAVIPMAQFGNRTDILMADIPAGAKMSARAVARMYAALLDDVDGIRLVSPERLRELSAVAVDDVDQVMGGRIQVTLGYAHGRLGADPEATPTTFGMPGVGGSYACADTATGTAFAVTKNRLTADFVAVEQVGEIVTKAVTHGGQVGLR
jgi:CubicO group peptidase (beta-lactamase class C family)